MCAAAMFRTVLLQCGVCWCCESNRRYGSAVQWGVQVQELNLGACQVYISRFLYEFYLYKFSYELVCGSH